MPIVGNPGLLCSHSLDLIECMKIYSRLFESIAAKMKYEKTIIDTIEIIDLENKATYCGPAFFIMHPHLMARLIFYGKKTYFSYKKLDSPLLFNFLKWEIK